MSSPPSAEVTRVRTRSLSRQLDSGQKRPRDWLTGQDVSDEQTEPDKAGSVHGSGGNTKRQLSVELHGFAGGSANNGSESGSEQEHNVGGIQGPQALVDHGETLDSYRHIQNCQWYLDYSHGVVHDFDKPTENATEKAPEENVGEDNAYQTEALKLHLKVRCRLSLWATSTVRVASNPVGT